MARTEYSRGSYVASEAHIGIEGRHYVRSATKRGIVACHGNSQTALTALTDSDHRPPYFGLADRGLCVGSADLGSTAGTPQWGNDTVRTRVGEVWAYLQSRFGAKTDKMLLLALSGGTPAALNYARQNPSNVAAIALLIPIPNVQDAYDNRGFSASIETAYGSAWAASAATHDPAASGNQAALAGIPIHAWTSSNDTAAVASVVNAYAALVGGSMAVSSMGAIGHSTSALNPNDVYDFFAPYV